MKVVLVNGYLITISLQILFKLEDKNVHVNTFYFSDNSIECIAVLNGFCSRSEGHFII